MDVNCDEPVVDLNYDEFKELFPPGTKIISIKGTREKFEGVVRCQCKNKEDFVENWLKPYELLNNVGLRTCVTRPRTGKVVLYKAIYRCHHNTYPKSHIRNKKAHKKHTDCPAVLRITIKAPTDNRRIRSKDNLRAEYPTLVTVIHNHNHDLNDMSDNLFSHKRMIFPDKAQSRVKNNESSDNTIEDTCFDSSIMNDYAYEELVVTEESQKVLEDEEIKKYDIDNSVETEYFFCDDLVNVDDSKGFKGETDSLIWSNLKERFDLLFKKWEINKSKVQYEALQRALSYLEEHNDLQSSYLELSTVAKSLPLQNHDKFDASGVVFISYPKTTNIQEQMCVLQTNMLKNCGD